MYEVIVSAEPDVVIRYKKEGGTSEKFLAILPSQGIVYVRTDSPNRRIEKNSEKAVAAFMSNLDNADEIETGVQWLPVLPKGIPSARALVNYVTEYSYYIKKGYLILRLPLDGKIVIDSITPGYATDVLLEELSKMYGKKNVACAMGACTDYWNYRRNGTETSGIIDDIRIILTSHQYHVFEKDFTKSFIRRMIKTCLENGIDLPSGIDRVLDVPVSFDESRFFNYLMNGADEQCFTDRSRFVDYWADTLNMQYLLYDKVEIKYPTHLASLHDQLSYHYEMAKQEIDAKKFVKRLEMCKDYEWKSNNYIFRLPADINDIKDEARQQGNCLFNAGYASRFADGNCVILFMRDKRDPLKSLVTMEIRDGEIRQALSAGNRRPDASIRNVIQEYATEKKLRYYA